MNIDELMGYAGHVNADSFVKEWVRNVLSKQDIPLEEAEHIIDFLVSEEGPERVTRMSFEDAQKATDKWDKALQKKGASIIEEEGDTEVVLDFGDGFKIVKLVGKNSFEREGYLMRHCAASYADRTDTEVFSLRDAKNMPHATMEKNQQIKGKGNGDISPKYVDYIVKFLEYTGMKVGDREMKHIGYINISTIADHLHPSILEKTYKGKYIRENIKLIDRDGEDYASLELLSIRDLLALRDDTVIEANIDVRTLCEKSPRWLKSNVQQSQSGNCSQQSQSGDYSQQSQSGNCSQQSQSGNDSQQAQSGDYSQQSQSGDYSRQAQSGYRSRQVQSGDYSQQSQSGNCSQQSQSGNDSQQAQSGDYSQQSQSGDYSQQSQSGNCSQQSQSGDYSRQAQSGYRSRQAQSGYRSRQVQSGDDGWQEMKGEASVSMCAGHGGKVKGKKGCWFALTEWSKDKNEILSVQAFKIDGEIVKENTWYELKGGILVEVDEAAI